MTGAERIAAERQRQIEVEGYAPEHDAEHIQSDLLAGAHCYLATGLMFNRPSHPCAAWGTYETPQGESGWPWDDGWKPDLSDPIPNLVKAGALIAAEIDRLAGAGENEP